MATLDAPLPREYFIERGLYEEYSLDSAAAKRALARIQFYVGTFDSFCTGCKSHSIFVSTVGALPDTGPGLITRTPPESVDALIAARQAWLPHTEDEGASLAKQDVLAYLTRPKIFTNRFVCSRNTAHELRFITKVWTTHFEKIGQTPALADLHLGDLSKYRGLLGPQYGELARGIGLHAHGIGIGSFVYLRRIFERFIGEAYAAASKEPGWDESAFQKGRMDDRILLLKRHLPAFVVTNRAVYGILSKGIHELAENECLQFFPAVRAAVELMLDEKLAAIERDKKIAQSTSQISGIVGMLRGNQ